MEPQFALADLSLSPSRLEDPSPVPSEPAPEILLRSTLMDGFLTRSQSIGLYLTTTDVLTTGGTLPVDKVSGGKLSTSLGVQEPTPHPMSRSVHDQPVLDHNGLLMMGSRSLNHDFVRSSSTGLTFESIPVRKSDIDSSSSSASISDTALSRSWTPDYSVDSQPQYLHSHLVSGDSASTFYVNSNNSLVVPPPPATTAGDSSLESSEIATFSPLDITDSRRIKGDRYSFTEGLDESVVKTANSASDVPNAAKTSTSLPVSPAPTPTAVMRATISSVGGFGPNQHRTTPQTVPQHLEPYTALGTLPTLQVDFDHSRPPFTLGTSHDSSIGYAEHHLPLPAPQATQRQQAASDIYVSPAQDFNTFSASQSINNLEVLAAPFRKEFTDMFTTSQLASLKYVVDLAKEDPHRVLLGLRTALEAEIVLRQKQINVAKNWNKEFWRLVRLPDSEHKFTKMRALAQDFVFTSEAYGRLIISEMYLLPSEKTVHPLKLGGIAGGQKFVCQGILFKFAMDVALEAPNGSQIWMYGGSESCNEYAMKSAKHEFNSIVVVNNLRWQGVSRSLRVALTTIIDFRGFRLSCQALLPIGKNTLVYGSDNGGTTHLDDAEFRTELSKVCDKLNIKPHSFTPSNMPPRLVHGPVDLEGHRVGKALYAVDLARLFPPESPKLGLSQKPRAQFFRMLRPELVRQFHMPLSSDAHTAFGRDDAATHNSEVDQATLFLQNTVIPAYAETLSNKQQLKQYVDGSVLVREMHRWGINLRYIGFVRSKLALSNSTGRHILLLEMVLRCLKNLFRRKLRKQMETTCVSMDSPYAQVVIDLLNLFLGKDEHSRVFWRVTIKEVLRETFVVGLTEEELQASFSLKRGLNMQDLLDRFQVLTGVKLIPSASTYRKGKTDVILYTDLAAVQNTVTKHMQIVDYAEGALLLLLSEKKADQAEKLRLLSLAEAHLKLARGSAMGNQSLYQLGQVFYMRHKVAPKLDLADVLSALTYYRAVIDSSHDEEHLRVSLKHTLELYYNYVSNSVWLQHKLFGSELVSPFLNPLVPLPSPHAPEVIGPSAATSAIVPSAAVPLSASGGAQGLRDSAATLRSSHSASEAADSSDRSLRDSASSNTSHSRESPAASPKQVGKVSTNGLTSSSTLQGPLPGESVPPHAHAPADTLPAKTPKHQHLSKASSALPSEMDLFSSMAVLRRTAVATPGATVANLFHQHCCLVFEKLAALNYKDAVKDASKYVKDACNRQGDSLRWIFAVSLYSAFVQAKLRTYLQRQPQMHVPYCPQLFVSKQDSIVYRFLLSMKPARKSAHTGPHVQLYHAHSLNIQPAIVQAQNNIIASSLPEASSGPHRKKDSIMAILSSSSSGSLVRDTEEDGHHHYHQGSHGNGRHHEGGHTPHSPEHSPRNGKSESPSMSPSSTVYEFNSMLYKLPACTSLNLTGCTPVTSTILIAMLQETPFLQVLILDHCSKISNKLASILGPIPGKRGPIRLQKLSLAGCSKITDSFIFNMMHVETASSTVSGALPASTTSSNASSVTFSTDTNGGGGPSASDQPSLMESTGTLNHSQGGGKSDSKHEGKSKRTRSSSQLGAPTPQSSGTLSKTGPLTTHSSATLTRTGPPTHHGSGTIRKSIDLNHAQTSRDLAASPLNLLRDMVSLNLSHCRQLTDEALLKLSLLCGSKLVELNMSGSKVSELSPLNNSTSLRKLVLDRTQVRDEALESFLSTVAFHGLFELSLAHCDLSDGVFASLSQNIQLRTLDISENHVGDTTLSKLSQYAPHLSDLDVGTVTLDDRAILLLLAERLPHLTRLKLVNAQNGINGALISMQKARVPMMHLEVPWCSVRDIVVHGLGSAFPMLQSIDLTGSQLSNAPLEKLKLCSNLRTLNLSWATQLVDPTIVEITAACLHISTLALAHCPQITSHCLVNLPPGLTSLDISHCPQIFDLGPLRSQCINLTNLNLANCLISEDRLSGLFGSGILLKSINLKGCKQVSSKFVSRMAKYSPLLNKAILDECINITEDGLRPLLVNCPYLQRVAFTGVTNVTDSSILSAVQSHGLRHLKEINLSGCKQLTDTAISAIAANCALLNDLSLSGCSNISPAPIREIANNCHTLRTLNVLGCKKIQSDILPYLAQHCKVLERVVGISQPSDSTPRSLPFLVE